MRTHFFNDNVPTGRVIATQPPVLPGLGTFRSSADIRETPM